MYCKAFFSFFLFLGFVYAPFLYADGVLGVSAMSPEKTYAQADGDFAHGWKWVFSVTVPSNEPVLQMKFGNWTVAGGTVSAAGNIRFYSAQSSNAVTAVSAITVAAADTYGSVMNLLPTSNMAFDLSTSTPGRQIQITVEARIPTGTSGGSYTGSFGIITNPDTTAPVISLLGSSSVTLERGTAYTDAGATASDNIDGNVTSGVVLSGTVTSSSIGTYTLSYNLSDSAGNAASTITRSIVVQDTIAPTGTVSYSTTTPTNADVVATLNPSESVTVTNNGGATTTTFTQNGSFTFLFADVGNNTGSTTATVGNIDKIAPSIASFSLNGVVADIVTNNIASSSPSIALTASEPVNWLSIKIEKQSDASVYKLFQSGVGCEDGGTSCSKIWTGDLSFGTLSDGTYRVRVRIKDGAGNETDGYLSKTIVVDATAPVITITGSANMTIDAGSSYTDAGAIALDERDGTVSVSSSGAVNANVIGDYTISYTATDALGNTASTTRTVHVVPVPVTNITVSGGNSVLLNSTIQMTATVLPNNATNATVTWSVFNTQGRATIDSATGILTGTQINAVKVRATATDGSGVTSSDFTVTVHD